MGLRTFGQSESWKLRPTSADDFKLPDDIGSVMPDEELNTFKRKKKRFNPWKGVKTLMTFAKLTAQKDNAHIDNQLDGDQTYRIPPECDKSYILGKAYHRTTRPRKPMRRVSVSQECGSILAYSHLDKKPMTIDPSLPNPPNHMKIVGKEGLPRFNAQSLDLIAEEQMKLATKSHLANNENEEDEEPEELCPRSKKYNEKNLFPHMPMGVVRHTGSELPPEMLLRQIVTVRKAAKRFVKRNTTTGIPVADQ